MSFNYQKYLPDFTSENDIKCKLVNAIRNYLNSDHACLVTNGTDALEIALRACNIPRGGHVIVPNLSFIATATAVANCGLLPLFCDIDENYYGLAYDSLVERYTPKVKAVVLVHFAGYVHRDIFNISDFCKAKGIYLIEDCAQAFPCSIDGCKVGTIGDIGTCSFQTSKIINAGEGGSLVTNSSEINRRIEVISDWGIYYIESECDFSVASSNYRMSAVQAYFLLKQIENIEAIVKERQTHATQLSEYIKSNGLEVQCPTAVHHIVDCPFFLPITSMKKFNTVEPRGEYPMQNSVLVKTIIKQFYPDLLAEYIALNNSTATMENCNRVIKETDFINIAAYINTPFKDIIKPYLDES